MGLGMIAVERTIISQYSSAPTITALIQSLDQAIDPSVNFEAFYNLVWNIDTAAGYGLDVWGRILGVGRVLQVSNAPVFGFEEALPGPEGFNVGVFYKGGETTSNYALADPAYRMLLFAKAAANICDCSIPAINAILRMLFPPTEGNCYVTDGQDMTMTYTFDFTPTPVELAIVEQSGVLPRPAGVALSVVTP